MGKKFLFGLFIGLVLVLSLIPAAGILLWGPSGPAANEILSGGATLIQDGQLNDNYLSDIAAWLNDHFFLRQELISVDNYLTGKVFGTSGENSVILGENGWLYYASTLGDYTGTDTLTDRELFSAAKNLQLMQEYCDEAGMNFTFVIALNKNSLYPQNMPYYGVKLPNHDAHRLMALLEESGVSYVNFFEVFAHEPVLYYQTDSHWNQQGAALAADAINAALGVETDYYAGPFGQKAEPYTGDLFEMLYPAFSGSELEPEYLGELEFTYTGNSTKADSIVLTTQSDADGSILVYRDSFGNLLHPYLAASYGSARFSRSTAYDLTAEYENVVVEIAERNLVYLIQNVPVMVSPQREIDLPQSSGTASVTQKLRSKAPEGTVLWTGTLENTDPDSCVYVACGGAVYEAFLTQAGGYAVYLPEGETPDTVAFTLNGQMTTLTLQ